MIIDYLEHIHQADKWYVTPDFDSRRVRVYLRSRIDTNLEIRLTYVCRTFGKDVNSLPSKFMGECMKYQFGKIIKVEFFYDEMGIEGDTYYALVDTEDPYKPTVLALAKMDYYKDDRYMNGYGEEMHKHELLVKGTSNNPIVEATKQLMGLVHQKLMKW